MFSRRFTQLSHFWQAAAMRCVHLFSIYQHQHHNFRTTRVDSLPIGYDFNITGQIRWEPWHRRRSLGSGWWTSHAIFFHQNPPGSDLSTQSWSRAFGPVLLRLPNKWLLVLWKSATLIFNPSSFFVLLLPFPHIILRFQCPAAMSDRKGTWCPMKNVSLEADTVWEFYYRDEVWSADEINMFLRLRAVAGPAPRDAGAGVELDLCNTG